MYNFDKLTPVNGFDESSLDNARQNNYAWSMAELKDYIYVGTGRNILVNIIKGFVPTANIPLIIRGNTIDNAAEIWRYKKDGSMPWQRVLKVSPKDNVAGFRYMINHKDIGGNRALFAAGIGEKVIVYKSRNGVTWCQVDNIDLEGVSSRAMVSLNGKLYLATMTNEIMGGSATLLYSSDDPEFYPWKLETPTGEEEGCEKLVAGKNPVGGINSMIVFNNKIYIACSTDEGIAVWRTNGSEPKVNDWTLIVDKGFGDSTNESALSMGVFNGMLYVSATKSLPLSWAIPIGSDLIRINKRDQWQLVVGGKPIKPSTPSKGKRGKPVSGLTAGFGNPFNVYGWQIVEHKGKLLVGTFDDSSNMEVIRDLLLANIDLFETYIERAVVYAIAKIYEGIIALLDKIKYPVGFDLYESEDGENFSPVSLNGLNNPDNYGARILMVDSKNDLYIGTANPFEGCEVWKGSIKRGYEGGYDYSFMKRNKSLVGEYYDYNYIDEYRCLADNKEELKEAYDELLVYVTEVYEKILEEKKDK